MSRNAFATWSALTTFTANTVVTDERLTYRGRDEIAAWLGNAGREHTYTTEFSDATRSGTAVADVV